MRLGDQPISNYAENQLSVFQIYQEHEVRFRVDKNIKLLGVGFGFLFSNTDMGVTVHCQGPWERVQWTDMTQVPQLLTFKHFCITW